MSLPAGAVFAQNARAPAMKLKLSRSPKGASGMQLDATYVRRRILTATKLVLPKGSTINTRAVARCNATADQLTAAGGADNACPPDARIGTVTAQLFIADNPDPIAFSGSAWNYATSMLVELELGDTAAYYVTGRIRANTVDYSLAIAEQLNAHVTKVTLNVDNAGTKRRPYLRMPPTCPNGRWTAREVNTYAGGVRERAKTTVPCRRTRT
jgi:hypothetical protein